MDFALQDQGRLPLEQALADLGKGSPWDALARRIRARFPIPDMNRADPAIRLQGVY